MAKINTRSPYYITTTATNLTQVDYVVRVYTGTRTTDRNTGAKFNLTSQAIANVVTVEIGELVSDYILSTFNGDYECTNVWVDIDSQSYIQGVAQGPSSFSPKSGFNGYGFFEQGANPQLY